MGGSMRRLARWALILGLLVAAVAPAAPWAASSAQAEGLTGVPGEVLATLGGDGASAPERLVAEPHFGFNNVLGQATTTQCATAGQTCRAFLSTVGLSTSGSPVVEVGPVQIGPCPTTTTDNCVQFTVTSSAGGFTVQGIVGPAQPFLIPGDLPLLRIPVVDLFQNVSTRDVQCGPVGPDGRSVCSATVPDPVLPQSGGQVEVRVPRNQAVILPPVANIPPPPLEFIPQPPPPPLLPPGPPIPPLQGAAASGPPSPPARYPAVPVIPEADSALLLVGGLAVLGAFAWWRRNRAD